MSNIAKIEKLSHEGRGIARIDGKTTFIAGALANELVEFEYTRKKSSFDEGRVRQVLEPAVNRTTPACAHFPICGGCSLQHMDANSQIAEKQALFIDVLQRIAHAEPATLLAPLNADVWSYRHKARLSVRLDFVMRIIHVKL